MRKPGLQRGAQQAGKHGGIMRLQTAWIRRDEGQHSLFLGLDDRVHMVQGDAMQVDLSAADVVTLYLLTRSNEMLKPSLERYLHPGPRVVSNQFPIKGWRAITTYGNSGANILREDRFKNLDLSLFKQFRFNERARLQFRAEAFNLTNSPSFSAPGTNIDTASGGVVTSTISAPRNVQFGLKLIY